MGMSHMHVINQWGRNNLGGYEVTHVLKLHHTNFAILVPSLNSKHCILGSCVRSWNDDDSLVQVIFSIMPCNN